MAADVGADVVGPSSRSTSFIAVKIGRSGQPVQKPGGRACTLASSRSGMTFCAAGTTICAGAGSTRP